MDILAPSALITLGKKAGSVVDALLSNEIRVYCVPRTIGDPYVSDQAATRGDKMPLVAAWRIPWQLIVEPSLDILAPSALITLGKKAGSVVDALLSNEIRVYCVPRTIGDPYVSDQAQEVHALMRSELKDE